MTNYSTRWVSDDRAYKITKYTQAVSEAEQTHAWYVYTLHTDKVEMAVHGKMKFSQDSKQMPSGHTIKAL